MHKKIIDGKGGIRCGIVGMVDTKGVFCLMLDDNTTVRYNFSTENELIQKLYHDNEMYERQNQELRDKVTMLDNRNHALRECADNRQKRIERLESKLDAIQGVVA